MYEQDVRHTSNEAATTVPGFTAAVASGPGPGRSTVRRTSGPVTGGVVTRGLGKQFGDMWALRDLHLDVAPGTVLGLLGHNGAGKTTAIRILTTLSSPSEGSAQVAGIDVVEDPGAVRRRIGVAAQQATVDGLMSARANLEMVGRLHHLPRCTTGRGPGRGPGPASCSSGSTWPTPPSSS
jgi:ABC-type transport system involved in cytochrome bd biosynthesis fused ATPase/permease subunit